MRCGTIPRPAAAAFQAFNRWLEEDWGFAHEGRIFAVPYVQLLDPQAAVDELGSLVERGARRRQRPQRPGPGARRLPVALRPGVRPVLGPGRRVRGRRRHPRGQRRLRRADPDVGAGRGRELDLPVAPAQRRHQEPGRSATSTPPPSATRSSSGSRPCAWPAWRTGPPGSPTCSTASTTPPTGTRATSPNTRARPSASTCGSRPSGRTTSRASLGEVRTDRLLLGSDWPHAEGTRRPLDFVTETLAGAARRGRAADRPRQRVELLGVPVPG